MTFAFEAVASCIDFRFSFCSFGKLFTHFHFTFIFLVVSTSVTYSFPPYVSTWRIYDTVRSVKFLQSNFACVCGCNIQVALEYQTGLCGVALLVLWYVGDILWSVWGGGWTLSTEELWNSKLVEMEMWMILMVWLGFREKFCLGLVRAWECWKCAMQFGVTFDGRKVLKMLQCSCFES